MDFKEFFLALATDWVSLMSGIASVALTIVGIAKKWQQIPRSAFWMAALICFFFAAARVWTTEHRKYLEEAKKNTPLLVGEIEDIAIPERALNADTGEPLLPVGAWVNVRCTISNLGMQSVVRNYSLRIKTVDGQELEATPYELPPTITAFDDNGKAIKTYRGQADALYDKTFPTPLASGAAVTGFLLFAIPNVKPNTIIKPGTVFAIRFQDVTRKQYEASYTWRNLPYDKTLRHYPGTQPETPKQP